MCVGSGRMTWLLSAVILGCLSVHVQPRDISLTHLSTNKHPDQRAEKAGYPMEIYERYVADLVELELRSVPEEGNQPPVIEVHSLHRSD